MIAIFIEELVSKKIAVSRNYQWETDKKNKYIMWEDDLYRVSRGDNWRDQWTCAGRYSINGHSWMTRHYCEKSQWQRLTASRSGKKKNVVGRLAGTSTSSGCSNVISKFFSQQYLLHLSQTALYAPAKENEHTQRRSMAVKSIVAPQNKSIQKAINNKVVK